MGIMEELEAVDVQDSMNANVDVLMRALDELEKGGSKELLEAIKTKVDEVEDYYWRPLDSKEFYHRFSAILDGMGMKGEAADYGRRVGMIESADLELRARILNFLGSSTEAQAIYREALEHWPENEAASKGLEKASKRMEKARVELRRFESREDTPSRLKYASALLNLGMADRAVSVVQDVLERGSDPDAELSLALLHAAGGKWAEAKAILVDLKEQNPKSVKIRRALNYANYHLDDEVDLSDL